MDIACPTCAATYEIDDASVGESGRKVRCAGCGTVWRAFRDRPSEVVSAPPPPPAPPMEVLEVADPPPITPSESDIAPSEDLPAPAAILDETPAEGEAEVEAPAPPRKAKIVKGKSAKAGDAPGALRRLSSWPTLVVAGALGLMGASYAFREPLVRLAPPSAAVFAAIGLPVNLRGIDIRDVRSRMGEDNGVSVLVIDGALVNVAKDKVTVPRLRFAVLGDKGQEIYVWSAQADKTHLMPGETLAFRRRLAAPPVDGRDVNVRFLSASDITAGLK